MTLLSDLMIIDKQSEPDDNEQAVAVMRHYIQSQLNRLGSYVSAEDGETRLYKEADKIRLVTLFKKDYEALREAAKNNKFKHKNLDEIFEIIYFAYLTKYKIDAHLPESKKSEIPELKSSHKDTLPTHLSLIKHLNDQDLEGLRSALNLLKDHYHGEEKGLSEFINRPSNEDIARLPGVSILCNYVRTISNLPHKDKSNEQLASFAYQAVQLLIRHGAHTYIEMEMDKRSSGSLRVSNKRYLLFSVMIDVNCDRRDNLLYQTLFKALIDAGADLTIKSEFGFSLLHDAINIYRSYKCNSDFYVRYLTVECGVSFFADWNTEKIIRSSDQLGKFCVELSQERREKENEYSQKKSLISQSLFALPKPLIELTLEYCKNYSPAFLRSVGKVKLKPMVEDNKPSSQSNLTV